MISSRLEPANSLAIEPQWLPSIETWQETSKQSKQGAILQNLTTGYFEGAWQPDLSQGPNICATLNKAKRNNTSSSCLQLLQLWYYFFLIKSYPKETQ